MRMGYVWDQAVTRSDFETKSLQHDYVTPSKPCTMYPELETMYPVPETPRTSIINKTEQAQGCEAKRANPPNI